jgi:hypothetical protein
MAHNTSNAQMCAGSELILDHQLYPRCRINDAYVTELAEALQAGATFPPLLVDKKTRKIIDGAHRFLAYQRVYGDSAQVPVNWANCNSEADFIRLAIEANTKHGMRLERVDQRRCVHLLSTYNYPVAEIAMLLALPVQRVELLKAQVAVAPQRTPQVIPGTAYVPLKRSVVHLAGQKLSQQQLAGLQSAPGTSYRLLIQQLTEGIQKDLLPKTPAMLNALADCVSVAVALLQQHLDQLTEERRHFVERFGYELVSM